MHYMKGYYEAESKAESKWVDAGNRNDVFKIIDNFMATLA